MEENKEMERKQQINEKEQLERLKARMRSMEGAEIQKYLLTWQAKAQHDHSVCVSSSDLHARR